MNIDKDKDNYNNDQKGETVLENTKRKTKVEIYNRPRSIMTNNIDDDDEFDATFQKIEEQINISIIEDCMPDDWEPAMDNAEQMGDMLKMDIDEYRRKKWFEHFESLTLQEQNDLYDTYYNKNDSF